MVDMAEQVVLEAQRDALKAVTDDFTAEDGTVVEEKYASYRALYTKIKPEWRATDAAAIEQLKSAAGIVCADIFSASFEQLDRLYTSVRVPKMDQRNKVMKDQNGRTVWVLDADGDIVEDWSSLRGDEIERTLVKLQELRFEAAQRVKEMFLETVFAKNVLQDDWHDAYESMVEGTSPRREAIANKKTKDLRSNYLFRFWIYSIAEVFEKELKDSCRLLERIRTWRIQETNRWEN